MASSEDLQPQNARDAQICRWLEENGRGGYVRAFLGLQRDNPKVLGEFNDYELLDLFSNLPQQPKSDPTASLSFLLGNMSL